MSHIFVSYYHNDRDYVDKLIEQLEQERFKVWIDQSIDYGDRWFKAISEAISSSAAFVVVMTPEAEQSEWVHKEILLAKRGRKPIFPLLLRGREFALLIDVQYVDVRRGKLPPAKFYKRIAKHVPRPIPAHLRIEKWAKYETSGSNDFFGIAMYALALEALDQREKAIQQLRRANKLEPRIKNRKWMSSHYQWTAVENELLERILTDPAF